MIPAIIPGPGRSLERLRFYTTLGIRFWDVAFNTPVNDGLVVRAKWIGTNHPPVRSQLSTAGVYAFHGLPGMRDVELLPDDAPFIPALPTPQTYLITVEDTIGRFLPMVFGVVLPLPYRGLFLSGEPSSIPGAPGRAFLFSAPTRPIPSGVAVVRADLWDITADAPAAFAAVRIQRGPDVWTGIADQQGRVLVVFPFPLVERLRMGSPPGLGQGALTDMTWPITIRVNYHPSQLQQRPLAGDPDYGWPLNAVPSLLNILDGQAHATIRLRNQPPLDVNQMNADLRVREELLLKTQISGPVEDRARLWILAAP